MTRAPGVSDWLLLGLLGAIWGGSFMGVSVALEGFGPLTVSAGRISVAAVVLLALAAAMGQGLPDRHTKTGRRIWLHAFGFAVFTNVAPFSLLAWAQLHVTSGFAGITMAAVPLFLLPMAHFVLPNERMSLRKVIGFLTGFAGVVVLIGPSSISFAAGDATLSVARLACILAAMCYATGSLITRTAPPVAMITFSSAGVTLGACMILPIAIFQEGLPEQANWASVLGVIYLGLFPTALATVILVRVINSAGPTFLSLVNYQVPVWAVVLGLVFLGESARPGFFAALVLILLGLAISQARAWRFRQ